MTDQQILEGNALIAKFMNWTYGHPDRTEPRWQNQWFTPKKEGQYRHEILKFDSSWNWLMPVAEKIESLGWNINILRQEVTIYDDKFKARNDGRCIVKNTTTKLESLFLAIVEFIELHNERNKQNP